MKNYLAKLETILTYLFLITLPWQTRYIFQGGMLNDKYWEYGTIALYATDCIAIVLLIIHFIRVKKLSLKPLWLIFCMALLIANIYISSDKILMLTHSIWLLLGCGIFLAIKNSLLSKKQLLIAFIVGAALAGFFAIWQFNSQIAPASKYLGLASHDPSDLGVSVIEAVAPDGVIERWLRAYGPLDHPNMLGGYLMIAFICILYLARERQNNNTYKIDLILFISLIGIVGGLIISFSRSAWIAASLASIIFIFFNPKQLKTTLQKIWPILGISIIIAALFAIPYYYLFIPRFTADSRLEGISLAERQAGYKESLQIIKAHPIIGSGLGNYGLEIHESDPKQLVWYYQPVHNTFLLILCELGLAGLLLVLGALYRFIKNINMQSRSFAYSIVAGLVVIALLDHWLFSLHFGPLFGALTLGLAAHTNVD